MGTVRFYRSSPDRPKVKSGPVRSGPGFAFRFRFPVQARIPVQPVRSGRSRLEFRSGPVRSSPVHFEIRSGPVRSRYRIRSSRFLRDPVQSVQASFASPVRSGPVLAFLPVQSRSGPVQPDFIFRPCPVQTGPGARGTIRSGPVRSCSLFRSGPVRSSHVLAPARSGPVRSGPRTRICVSGPVRSGSSFRTRSGPVRTVRRFSNPVRSGPVPVSPPVPFSGPVRFWFLIPVRSGSAHL